jgi:hypothetical protein
VVVVGTYTYKLVGVETYTCKLVVEEKGTCMASLVEVVVKSNDMEEEVSALVVAESDNSKASLVVVEMNKCSCLLKPGLASLERLLLMQELE